MYMASFSNHIFVVILCGGGGTRVWPLSVKNKPKQFLNFYSNKTLYQDTVERATWFAPCERIIVVTNKAYVDEIRKQTPEIPPENIIAEPEKKNTALAMGLVAAFVKKRDPQGVIINLASDHVIGNKEVFINTLLTAAQIAYEDNVLVSVGITPTFPHPGLGYIHCGEKIKEVNSLPVTKVSEFREKPDIATAEQFLSTGEYLWNANNYTWTVEAILHSFDTLAPDIAKTIHTIEAVIGTDKEAQVMTAAYSQAIEDQIDKAISEKADNLVVIPGTFDWHDIGSWQVVYDLGKKDDNGNVVVRSSESDGKAPLVVQESTNNLIYCNNQPMAVVGIDDSVIIDTGAGILICDRKRSNDVKKIVEELKEKGFEEYI